MFTRINLDDASVPFEPRRLQLYWDGVLGVLPFNPDSPSAMIPEKSDIWWEAAAGASTEVTVDFELLLEDN